MTPFRVVESGKYRVAFFPDGSVSVRQWIPESLHVAGHWRKVNKHLSWPQRRQRLAATDPVGGLNPAYIAAVSAARAR